MIRSPFFALANHRVLQIWTEHTKSPIPNRGRLKIFERAGHFFSEEIQPKYVMYQLSTIQNVNLSFIYQELKHFLAFTRTKLRSF
jgi:hypothetical protein